MARFRGQAEKKTILFHVWLNLTCYHPPGQRNFSPSAPGMGNCLKRSCPGGRGVGQIKNNFSLILRGTCYFSRALHKGAELKTKYTFKGKRRNLSESGWRGITY